MYFLSKIYQGVKALAAVTGAAGSLVAITYGAVQSGGTVFIVGGSLCLLNSIFNLVELGKVNKDIKKQIGILKDSIKKFIDQNIKLEENVRVAEKNNEVHARENRRLQELVAKSEKHINRLEKIQQDLLVAKNAVQAEVTRLSGENQELADTSKELKNQLATIKGLKNELAAENNSFATTIQELRDQVDVVEDLKNDLATENQSLQVNNQHLETQISEQAKIIIESKSLIQNLAQFGDRYTSFADTLDGDLAQLEDTSADLDQTSRVLQKLADKLKNDTFDKLDIDGDGVITREEFQDGLGAL